uniref:MRPR1 n=1 Tax=Arundo donax TaxID=35708 RepID=A0A0A9H9H9_ARUDO
MVNHFPHMSLGYHFCRVIFFPRHKAFCNQHSDYAFPSNRVAFREKAAVQEAVPNILV